jgi:hypothetical protein
MRFSYTIFLLFVLLTGCGGADNSNSTSNTTTNSNSSADKAAKLPEFPWPPDASAFATIPSERLVKEGTGAKLGDVDKRLQAALKKAGYEQIGYYHIPGGFVVVTQLEQFDGMTGAPLAGVNRWSTKVTPPNVFSREYVRALIKGNTGHFRVIAFAVTNDAFTQTGKEFPASEAPDVQKKAANKLPADIASQNYDENYQCTALIYEFLQPNSGPAKFVKNSGLLASQHLQKILPFLEQLQ